jgi:RHS repeat-associated protein
MRTMLKKTENTSEKTIDRYYAGAFEYGNAKVLVFIHTDEVMVNVSGATFTYEYHLKDHLGNVRTTFTPGAAYLSQVNDYYPFGMISSTISGATNKYLYNGKELQDDNLGGTKLDWYDYGARFYDPQIGRWHCVDNMAEKFMHSSPYAYAINNPIAFVDIDGNEWFYYSSDGKSASDWHWRDEREYHIGVKDSNGNEVVLQGQETVVTANGSTDEKVGTDNNMFSQDSKLASFTVYGPGGKDDIKNYRGLTTTSDFKKYGAIDNGEYTVNFNDPGKTKLPYSNWAVNNTNPVNCLFGENPNPDSDRYSDTQKDQIYFHSTLDSNGKIGNRTSTGCIIIVPSGHGENGWNEFNAQLSGVASFHFVLIRTAAFPFQTFTKYPEPSDKDL